jgi:hypothetical protein
VQELGLVWALVSVQELVLADPASGPGAGSA